MFAWLRRRRREKLLAEPYPPHWDAVLARNVGHFARLTLDQQQRLRDVTRILVAEKIWESVGGFHVTEEVKITVAAQAGLLLLGLKDHDYYARVESVVIYPTAFRTPVREDAWEDDELSDTMLSGQAVYRGPVILSWDEVLPEGREPDIGYNVVLHEFAHQLDFLDGAIDGTPPLDDPVLAAKWEPVMQAAFDRHVNALKAGEDTFFTEHAAENETEFFADATEAFYCRPADLYGEEPDVYELLAGYYGVEPRDWFGT